MIKFGTGGWRAVIGDEFTKENIQILSRAICDKMREEKVEKEGIVLGYDRRFLSKEAMQWAAQVFAAEGIKASLINKSAPTPLVMFYVMKHEYHYGMMITASHNPAIYNGIKVFTFGGRDADEVQTADIERYINEVTDIPVDEMNYAEGIEKGLIEEIYPLNEYLDSIIDTVDMDQIKKRGLRIALDPMYGVSETSLKTILMTARCEVETIHERHDTLFGGKLPAPTAETLRALQNYVIDRRCDLGLATDGDADRIGVIDDQGNFLHPNDILVLLYYYLVKYKGWHGPAVRNICTTHLLDRVAESFGEQCYEVPVGFKHISAKMFEEDAIIGGESSGGMAVRGHIKGKDGIYASALLVEMIAVTGMKLSEIMPANGIWEAMFVNTEVLEAAGVAMPGADYTMDQFMADCEKIKAAGYAPIAAALGNIPHYWWEFAIFNNQSPETHLEIPENAGDKNGLAWVAGMNDIKELYDRGYFPENTLSATDDETFAMFTEGKAAFLLDGSWKVGGIVGACQSDPNDPATLDLEKLDKFDVTYVPGKGDRKATDLIGGLTSGYFITRKAWDDPEKRAAAVNFVEHMTSDELVPKFAQHGASALKNAPEVDPSQFNILQVKAMNMMAGATSLTGVVQDIFSGDCRVSTFDGMPEIVTGRVAAEDAVAEGLEIYHNQ